MRRSGFRAEARSSTGIVSVLTQKRTSSNIDCGRDCCVYDTPKQAKMLEDAASEALDKLIFNTSSLSMIPARDINLTKSMSDFGMDSLITIKTHN